MYIAIAGNIGSGKTTLATLLAKHLGFDAEYEDPTNNPYIFDFYKDMNRWSFNLQIYFLDVRLRQTLNIIRSGRKVVQDRTLYEDAEIFAPNLMAMGLMGQRDYDTYRNLFDTVAELIHPPDLMIYLHGGIATLVEQIASRNREYEDNIRMDYLKRLNECYDTWYQDYNRGKKIAFDISELNFKDNPEDLGVILKAVNAELYGLFKG
jgi:deoxyadenosine/deoxycytidine kinase